jgi:DNA-binding NarL/FixJ family response regulator
MRRAPAGCDPSVVAEDRARYLIVDDSACFLAAARAMLQREGVTVVGEALAGPEALRLATELRPDVILVDIDLGDESGIDLAERLAARQLGPVVLMSAYPEAEVTDLVVVTSVAGFVSKSDLSVRAVSALLDSGGGDTIRVG